MLGAFAAAAGIFSAGTGLWGAGKQAAMDEKRAELGYQDNLEKIRRREFSQEAALGQGKARSENAGVRHTPGSTPQGYMDVMAAEFKKELSWMQTYAERSKSLGLESAQVNQKVNNLNAISGGISAGMSIYGMG